ncbi:MAG: hypothetical protein V4447_00150 [Pseudomonadota bacterium]
MNTGLTYRYLSQALVTLLLLMALAPTLAQTVLWYPSAEFTGDDRQTYPLKILTLALSKGGGKFELKPCLHKMQQDRALRQLALGLEINVLWTMTSKEREKDLLPIRIPIDKGLLGWRIFLINTKNIANFEKLHTLDDLKNFQAVQGHDWPDTEILRANGLKVLGLPYYHSLFSLLQMGKVDYLPRSISEIWVEEKNHPEMDLTIEKNLILHYPTALYFFVNKRDQELARLIESGLLAAIKDGSFEKAFVESYGEDIKRTNFKGRKLFQLTNPLLPLETPLQDKKLWLSF